MVGALKVFVAGHDWGAVVAWQLCLLRPDLVTAHVSLSVEYQPDERAPGRQGSLRGRSLRVPLPGEQGRKNACSYLSKFKFGRSIQILDLNHKFIIQILVATTACSDLNSEASAIDVFVGNDYAYRNFDAYAETRSG